MSTNANNGNPAAEAPFNILFSCVGKRVVLMGAFAAALVDLGLTGKLVGTDITDSAPAMHVVDEAEIVCPTDDPGYIDRLKALVARHGIRLLVPLTDLDLPLLARHASEFADVGCTVMIAPVSTIEHCRNKIAFNDLVAKAGLPTTRTLDMAGFSAKPFFPCFVKPIGGSAAIGAKVIRIPAELEAHIASFGSELMFQEYLPGSEYTIDVYRRRDGELCAVVPRQRLAIRAGEVIKAVTVNDPVLMAATAKLVEQLPGLWGVFNAQCRRSVDGDPQFFEVNLRFGGGAPLTLAAGVDLPRMLISELTGRPVTPADGAFTDRLMMMRYDDAVFTQVDNPAALPGYDKPVTR